MIATGQMSEGLSISVTILLGSAIFSALLIYILRPVLMRYALARPNARSSHKVPVPQGAGIAVIAATILMVALASPWTSSRLPTHTIAMVLAAATFLAVVGAIDDWKPIPVLPRLFLQFLAVAAIVATISGDLRIALYIPAWLERLLLVGAILWFVNLTNFMDGLDWMTVAEMLPITMALAVFSLFDASLPDVLPITLALAGALVGFAPFNKPVARIFLGDVGSLPIGLIVAWCLVVLVAHHHLVPAILLPLYYLSDATTTLVLRLSRGEKVWEAHRTHFYQRATNNGFTVLQIVGEVFALNIILAILAGISIKLASIKIDALLLTMGAIATGIVMFRFSRPRHPAD